MLSQYLLKWPNLDNSNLGDQSGAELDIAAPSVDMSIADIAPPQVADTVITFFNNLLSWLYDTWQS